MKLSGTRLQAMRIPAWQTRFVGQRPIYTPHPLFVTKNSDALLINKVIAAEALEL